MTKLAICTQVKKQRRKYSCCVE